MTVFSLRSALACSKICLKIHDNVVFNIFLFHFILIIDAKGPGPIGAGINSRAHFFHLLSRDGLAVRLRNDYISIELLTIIMGCDFMQY